MANIFYAWEFGANLGHIGAFLPLARSLRTRGHHVHWALASSTSAGRMLIREGFNWLQAPVCPEQPRQGPPLSYADILLRFGYANSADLIGLVVAWRELMKLTSARLVLSDHAPTAILAARTLGIPTLTFSHGFCVPPPRSPTPNMRPWLNVEPKSLVDIDKIALRAINDVLAHFDCMPLAHVAELFSVEETSLMTFPELDHYAEARGPATYWGSLLSSVDGETPVWPDIPGPRLFAYVRPETRHAGAMLEALRRTGHASLVVFPGIPDGMLATFHGANVNIVTTPVDTHALLQNANIAITYGGHGLTTAFLLAGKPVLLLPGNLEQFLLARRIEQMGAGLLVDPEKPATDLQDKLQRIISDPLFAGNAQAFARKYAAFPQEVVIANLVRRIEEICA